MTKTSAHVALFSMLAACGGARGAVTTTAQGVEPCPNGNEVRLGRTCWNPSGSRWHIAGHAPGGEHAFDVELLAGNRLRATDHPEANAATDEWFVENNVLRLFLADRYVEYRAKISNGTVMVGDAINVRGDTWDFRGDRLPERGTCEETDASFGTTCFAIAGTHWQIAGGEGGQRIWRFEPGGHLGVGNEATRDEDRWSQEGSRVRITRGERVTEVTLESSDSLTGQGLSGTRMPLYPPPYH